MKQVYIASLLRGDYNANIKNAVEHCKNCGFGVALAPHIIFGQWCNDTIPEQRKKRLTLVLRDLSEALKKEPQTGRDEDFCR